MPRSADATCALQYSPPVQRLRECLSEIASLSGAPRKEVIRRVKTAHDQLVELRESLEADLEENTMNPKLAAVIGLVVPGGSIV